MKDRNCWGVLGGRVGVTYVVPNTRRLYVAEIIDISEPYGGEEPPFFAVVDFDSLREEEQMVSDGNDFLCLSHG